MATDRSKIIPLGMCCCYFGPSVSPSFLQILLYC